MSPIRGPFKGPQDAARALGLFVDQAVGGSVGICWATADGLFPLRAATYDDAGYGKTVLVKWTSHPAAPAGHVVHAGGFWDQVHGWITRYFEMQGEIARAQAQMLSNAMSTLTRRAFDEHGADTLGVALDVVAVVLTIGFASTGLGLLALGAGVVLLAADGTAWGMEMAGEDEMAEQKKQNTVVIRWAAIIASLPDTSIGLYKLARKAPDDPDRQQSVGRAHRLLDPHRRTRRRRCGAQRLPGSADDPISPPAPSSARPARHMRRNAGSRNSPRMK